MVTEPQIIVPDWPAPDHIKAMSTTRIGGFSSSPYDSLNLALHTHDDGSIVIKNREHLQESFHLPSRPVWLNQIHSKKVISLEKSKLQTGQQEQGRSEDVTSDFSADASFTTQQGVVCAILTADCLPVLITDITGSVVAVAHAGWKGLVEGVISETIQALDADVENLLIWLGPAIGPDAFEVKSDVYDLFIQKNSGYASAFQAVRDGHWLCDVYRLAKIELAQLGVERIYGGGYCTFSDAERFYSFRRDGVNTGRNAHLIWIDSSTAGLS